MGKRKYRKTGRQEMKKTQCLPTHLPLEDANAVKCMAADAGVSVSEYIRRLIKADLKAKESKAQATLLALGYPREQIEQLERREPRERRH